MRVLAAVVIVALLAGCTSTPASNAPPEERAQTAAHKLADAIGPSGDLKKIEGTVGAQGQSGTMSIEFGKDGAKLVTVMAGGMFSITLYCDATRTITVFGNQSVEMRQSKTCSNADSKAPLNFSATPDVIDAVRRSDGGVTATLRAKGVPDAPSVKVEIDTHDRITDLTFDQNGTHAQLHAIYGARAALTPPTAKDRMPAQIRYREDFESQYSWTIQSADDKAKWEDLTVNVYARDDPSTVVASFAPPASSATANGFTFTLNDTNGNGLADAGDSFTISSASWQDRFDYSVKVFDEWAHHNIGDGPRLPGFGAPLLLMGLVGALVVMRRRA